MKSKNAAMSPLATLVIFIVAVALIGGATALPLMLVQHASASTVEVK